MMVRQHPGNNLLVPTSWMSCFVLLLNQDFQSPASSTPTDCGMSAASDVPLLLCKERRALTFNHLDNNTHKSRTLKNYYETTTVVVKTLPFFWGLMALYGAIRSLSFSCKHITGITSIPGICPARSKARLPFLSRNSWVRGIGPKWVCHWTGKKNQPMTNLTIYLFMYIYIYNYRIV